MFFTVISYNLTKRNWNTQMNNTQIAVIALSIALTCGFIFGATYTNNDQASVIHKTRSGSFIIQKNLKGEEQIYQVLELPGNVPSFVAPRD